MNVQSPPVINCQGGGAETHVVNGNVRWNVILIEAIVARKVHDHAEAAILRLAGRDD